MSTLFGKEDAKMQLTSIVCHDYLKEKELLGLKTSSLSTYSYTINSYILPYFPTYIEQINEGFLQDLIETYLLKANRKSMTDIILLVNDILKYAFLKHYLKTLYKLPIPKGNKKKIEVFTMNEQEILIHYLLEHFNNFNFGILLSLFTGIRIGELSALLLNDLDEVLHINKTLQRVKCFDENSTAKTVVIVDSPKSKTSIRDIPLQSFLQELISGLSRLDGTCYLLTGTRKYIEPRTVERRFKKILEECHIPPRKFHILRHTFATNAVKRGFEIKTLSEILGHSSVKITLDLYVHIDMETKSHFMNMLTPSLKLSQSI